MPFNWTPSAIINGLIQPDKPVKGTTHRAIQENIDAQAEGSDGAPKHSIRSLDTDAIMTLNSLEQRHVHRSMREPSKVFYSQTDADVTSAFQSPFAWLHSTPTDREAAAAASADVQAASYAVLYNYTSMTLEYEMEFEVYTLTDDPTDLQILLNGVVDYSESFTTGQPAQERTFARTHTLSIPPNSAAQIDLHLRLVDGGGAPDTIGVRGCSGTLTQPLA